MSDPLACGGEELQLNVLINFTAQTQIALSFIITVNQQLYYLQLLANNAGNAGNAGNACNAWYHAKYGLPLLALDWPITVGHAQGESKAASDQLILVPTAQQALAMRSQMVMVAMIQQWLLYQLPHYLFIYRLDEGIDPLAADKALQSLFMDFVTVYKAIIPKKCRKIVELQQVLTAGEALEAAYRGQYKRDELQALANKLEPIKQAYQQKSTQKDQARTAAREIMQQGKHRLRHYAVGNSKIPLIKHLRRPNRQRRRTVQLIQCFMSQLETTPKLQPHWQQAAFMLGILLAKAESRTNKQYYGCWFFNFHRRFLYLTESRLARDCRRLQSTLRTQVLSSSDLCLFSRGEGWDQARKDQYNACVIQANQQLPAQAQLTTANLVAYQL